MLRVWAVKFHNGQDTWDVRYETQSEGRAAIREFLSTGVVADRIGGPGRQCYGPYYELPPRT